MRAMAFPDFGAGLAAADLPVPAPGPGEVLVRVLASSVNGFDLGVLSGGLRGVYEYEFPVVLGKDFAGTVAAVGPGVTEWTPGADVFGVVMRPTLGQGGYAEYVVVNPQYGVAALPEGLDHARAGVLGLAGTAARGAVDFVAPEPGETVLVSGATGGVGSFAVQLAAACGARVIATARPGAEAAFVTGLGAAWAVDPADLDAQVRALAPGGLDAALHLAGDGPALAALLADGGRLASTVHFTPDDTGKSIKATAVMADPTRETLEQLAAQVVEGRLRIPLSRTYPLSDAPRALTDFTAGTVGKLAITL